jgi:hypothetical protein
MMNVMMGSICSRQKAELPQTVMPQVDGSMIEQLLSSYNFSATAFKLKLWDTKINR